MTEGGEVAGGGAELEAVAVLAHHDLVAAYLHRALGDHDPALEDRDLAVVVYCEFVRFDVDGLVAIGFFRQHHTREQERECGAEDTGG